MLTVILCQTVVAMDTEVQGLEVYKNKIHQKVAKNVLRGGDADTIFIDELHTAIHAGYKKCVVWLLEQRPHIILRKPFEGSERCWFKMALTYADSWADNREEAAIMDSIAIIFIDRLNQFAQEGTYVFAVSPLLAACTHQRSIVVQWLLTHNYDIHFKGSKGTRSACEWAAAQIEAEIKYLKLVHDQGVTLPPAIQLQHNRISQCASLVFAKYRSLNSQSHHQVVLHTDRETHSFEAYKNTIKQLIADGDSPQHIHTRLTTELSTAILEGSTACVTWLLDTYPDIIQNSYSVWVEAALTSAAVWGNTREGRRFYTIAILLLERIISLVHQGEYVCDTSPLLSAYSNNRKAVISPIFPEINVPDFKGTQNYHSPIQNAVNNNDTSGAQGTINSSNQLNQHNQIHIQPAPPLPPLPAQPTIRWIMDTPLWQKAIVGGVVIYACKKFYDWYYPKEHKNNRATALHNG